MAKIQLYKKNPCPYCDRAINFLNSKDVKFDIIDLTDKMDELQKLKDQYGWKTVPLILIDGKLVGGYTDLKDLDEAGQLDQMLKA
jgi:glutaredoxin 3